MEKIEIWDAYNADGTLAGVELVRGEIIPEGLRHAVAEVFVLHQDGTILLMKRDTNKPNYPGYWESGAGGAVLKGENFLDGAIRELEEETGINAINVDLIYKIVTANTIYQGYVCYVNLRKEHITLQQGETIDYKWVDKIEFTKIYRSEKFVSGLRERLKKFVDDDFRVEYNCSFQLGS